MRSSFSGDSLGISTYAEARDVVDARPLSVWAEDLRETAVEVRVDFVAVTLAGILAFQSERFLSVVVGKIVVVKSWLLDAYLVEVNL